MKHILRKPAGVRVWAWCAALCWGAALAQTESPVQFGSQCAEGLAQGRHVMTNCSVSWTDKDGKVYCFGNDAAKKAF